MFEVATEEVFVTPIIAITFPAAHGYVLYEF